MPHNTLMSKILQVSSLMGIHSCLMNVNSPVYVERAQSKEVFSSVLYQVQTSLSMAIISKSIKWVPMAFFINLYDRFLYSTIIVSIVSLLLQKNVVGTLSTRCSFIVQNFSLKLRISRKKIRHTDDLDSPYRQVVLENFMIGTSHQ